MLTHHEKIRGVILSVYEVAVARGVLLLHAAAVDGVAVANVAGVEEESRSSERVIVRA